jgi:hypothetical protein
MIDDYYHQSSTNLSSSVPAIIWSNLISSELILVNIDD